MSLRNFSTWVKGPTLTIFLVGAIAVGGFGWLIDNTPAPRQAAAAQQTKPKADAKHDGAEHASDTAALKQAFSGTTVDLYFDPSELAGAKPGLSELKFLDHVDVTGKELLRFEKTPGDTWLIDPDTVFAYRAHKAK